MAGVTLSVEEIRAAPIEVRRWLEHEVLRAFGVAPEPAAQPAVTLVGCNIDEVRDMLALVQDKLPVVSVFFELGREATSRAAHGMRAFRVADILSHTRLHTPDRVIECLAALTRALRQVRGDADAVLRDGQPGPLPGGGDDDAQHPEAMAGDRGAARAAGRNRAAERPCGGVGIRFFPLPQREGEFRRCRPVCLTRRRAPCRPRPVLPHPAYAG